MSRMKNTEKTMEKIVALCKNRGFVYPGSEIYGGLANTWDYGPLGVELKNNIKDAWRQKFIRESHLNVGHGLLQATSAGFQIRLWTAKSARHVIERIISLKILTEQMSQAGQMSR